MKEKLREHLDSVFGKAPDTQQNRDLKDEFYANLCDRYDEAIADGKSENEAYIISLRSIGDVHSLLGIEDATHAEPESASTKTATANAANTANTVNTATPSPADEAKRREYEENLRRRERKRQSKYIKGPVFMLILVAYFIVSFATGAWYITWLLFIINIFIDMVIDGIFEFRDGGQ